MKLHHVIVHPNGTWCLLMYVLLINGGMCYTKESNRTSLTRLPSQITVTIEKDSSFCQEMSVAVICDECDNLYCNGCEESILQNTLANDEPTGIQENISKDQKSCRIEEENKKLAKSVSEYKTALEQQKSGKEAIVQKKDARIRELENEVQSLQKEINRLEKILFNNEIAELKRSLQRKEDSLQEYMGKETRQKQENEGIIQGLIDKFQELTKHIEECKTPLKQQKDEQEQLNSQIDQLQEDLQIKESEIETLKKSRNQIKEENGNIIKGLEESVEVCKAALEDKETEMIQLDNQIGLINGTTRLKDSLIEELKEIGRTLDEENDNLKEENSDLQNQINTLKMQEANKVALLQKCLPQNKEATWNKIPNRLPRNIPSDTMISDNRRYNQYVCKTLMNGDLLPGYVCPQQNCIVYYNDNIHKMPSYEVLTSSSSFKWIPCLGEYIPPQAVPGGRLSDGELLYIARVKDTSGNYRVTRVQPSKKGSVNPWSGNNRILESYEILVWK